MVKSRKLAVVVGCLVVAAGASVSLWSSGLLTPDPGGPRLAFAETEFDFGEVNEGDTVVHRFKFANTGAEDLRLDPLVVTEVHASCSLPNALLVNVPTFGDDDTVVVKPGAANEVVLTLNTDGFAMAAFDGKFSQKVRIFTNDPRQPRALLHIKGMVKPVLKREPVEVQMGTVYKVKGESLPLLPPVRLIPTPGNVVRITKVEANVPYLKPFVNPAQDGEGYVLSGTIDPSIPEGPLGDVHLTVHTDHPKRPTVVIPVSATVYSERSIVASPDTVLFGVVKPGESLTSVVKLERVGDVSWKVLKTTGTADGVRLQTTIEPITSGKELRLSFKAPDRPWESFGGSIEVTTDSQRQPKIVVNFAGWTIGEGASTLPDDRLRAFIAGALNHALAGDPAELVGNVFGGFTDRRGFTILAAIARDETSPLQARVRAVDVMERYPGPKTVETLEAIVKSDLDEVVRDGALNLYYTMVGAKALPLMLERIEDKSTWLRQTAATALGEIGDERAREPLLKATRDSSTDVALAAIDSVEVFLPAVWPNLKK